MRKVIFVANRGYALISSRKNIIKKFLDAGWDVVVATCEDQYSNMLNDMGCTVEKIDFSRGGMNPLYDFRCIFRLIQIYRLHEPDLIHHFHAKPMIFGSFIGRAVLGHRVAIINSITGLGNAFVASKWTSFLAGIGYKVSTKKADATIFQNNDDKALFLSRNWVDEKKAELIIGSGVDVKRFEYKREEYNVIKVVMLGRLMGQKGVKQFLDVADSLKEVFPRVEFAWAGEEDMRHPDGISADAFANRSNVTYLGRLEDVRPLLGTAHVLLFTSYYREGVPRVVMEAAATGLPCVAFDVPGVREAVRNNETGFLVEPINTNDLAEKLAILLTDKNLHRKMSVAARELAENEFDIRRIEKSHYKVYQKFGVSFSRLENSSC